MGLVEISPVDQDTLFAVFSGKKALRERRAFVRQSIVGGNDDNLPGFAAVFYILFRAVAGHHPATEDYALIAGHLAIVLPICLVPRSCRPDRMRVPISSAWPRIPMMLPVRG